MTRASFAPHPHRDGDFTCFPVDRRVSKAEQEEDRPLPFGAWSVVLLVLSPLLVCVGVTLAARLFF